MNAEILTSHPLSGEFDELYFDSFGDTTCVKFEDDNYLEYCGIFGGGFGGGSNVSFHDNIAFVVAHGQGYVFDINKRAIIHKTDNDHLKGAIYTDFNNYFLAYNLTNLFVFDSTLVWDSQRVSADGIKIDIIEKGIVTGKVFNFSEWELFHLNLSTFEFKCDWECNLG
ncbi:MAG: hypothetical protein KKD44_01010 [Proteobacteria bacterium]|nr:hypothetical protein [Pseudomonadota bacterium]